METLEQPRVYYSRENVGVQAALCLAGGILFLLVMIALFVFNIAMPNNAQDKFLPGFIGGTSIVWIGLLGRGIYLLRSVTQVMIDPVGVHLQGFISRRTVRWDQIERIEVDKRTSLFGGKTHETVALFDMGGKRIGEIPATIKDYQSLGHEIAQRSAAARGHATYDTSADEERKSAKQLRKMRLLAVLSGFLALAMGAGFAFGLNEELHLRRYATQGTHVDATIVRRYMLRVTPYVEYSFTDSAGRAHSRNVMMNKDDWDELVYAKTIPVEYLSSDPEWNRPVRGEDEVTFGGPFLWLTGAMSLVFAFFCVASALGFDLKSEGGVMRLTRAGKTVRQWGRSKSGALPNLSSKRTFGLDDDDDAVSLDEEVEGQSPGTPFVPPQKPKGLFVLGILAIVFGALGVGLNLLRVAVLHQLSVLTIWNGIDALLAIALIVVGAGLIGMRSWSRSLGIVVSALQVTSSLAALGYLIVTSVRAPEVAAGDQAMILTAARIGAGVGELIGAAFPTVLFVILLKRSTGEALGQTQPTIRV